MSWPTHFFWAESQWITGTAGARMFPFASREGIGLPSASHEARL